jgi:hypothetical protein
LNLWKKICITLFSLSFMNFLASPRRDKCFFSIFFFSYGISSTNLASSSLSSIRAQLLEWYIPHSFNRALSSIVGHSPSNQEKNPQVHLLRQCDSHLT